MNFANLKSSRLVVAFAAAMVVVALAGAAIPANAQTFTVVASITDHAYSNPSGQIAQGRNGDVYAVTPANGWLFSTTTAGAFAGIYQVGGPSGVTLGSDGNFYTNFVFDRVGCGEVDKTTPLGTYSVLASICGNNGAFPYSAPIQASNGSRRQCALRCRRLRQQ